MKLPSFEFYPGDWQEAAIDPYGIPQVPTWTAFRGVYLWVSSNGDPLYIGESVCVRKRLKVHFRWCFAGAYKGRYMFDSKVPVEHPIVWVMPIADLWKRLLCERDGIAMLNPTYNIAQMGVWREDKFW